MFVALRKTFANIICAFVPDKYKRKKLRVILNSNIIGYVRFIKRDIKEPIHHIKTFVGYQARSLIIGVNNKYIYKFPLRRSNANELALREQRIVRALIPYSPIHIPDVEILKYKNILVRKYEWVRGHNRWGFPMEQVLANKEKYGRTLGHFIYKIACADPAEIADLKTSRVDRPVPKNLTAGFMRGWCQGDTGDNYMLDPDTMEIIAIIDWEDVQFQDFSHLFNSHKPGQMSYEIMNIARDEYVRLYNADHPDDIHK